MIEKLVNFFCQKLVRKKIKSQFGGNLKAFVSGGGALDYNVGDFFKFNWFTYSSRLWSDRNITSS